MKITVIADVLGQENNGTTATIKRLIDGLVQRGHEVTVVSPRTDGSASNPKYYTIPVRHFGVFDEYIKKNGVELGKPDENILRNAIKNADVVHIVLPFKVGKAAVKICKEYDVPFTSAFHCQPENVTSHIGMKNFKWLNKEIYLYFKHRFYKDVDYIHCPSEFIKNELEKNNYRAKKFAVSNGVIPTYHKFYAEKPKELKDKFLILFIGRMSNEKRHDVLIKAVKQSKYSDKIQLIFAGMGPLEKKVKKLGSKLINPPICGYYDKDVLAEIVNYCDLYVHPSDIEIEAIACLEAITCGLVPVIADSDRSATRFFAIDKKCLFKRGDPKDLASKIDYWIEHPEEKKELSEKYVEYAKQYSIENSLDGMIKMFETAVAEHAAKKRKTNE